MSELYEQIVAGRGSVENLLARIPGFKGYLDKSARRKADSLMRDFLAGQIDGIVTAFTRAENAILDSGGLAHMSKTREIKSKIQAYRDRVKTAAPGYSGMWAAIEIGDKELERLYAFDEAQIRFVDALKGAVEALEAAVSSGEGLESPLAGVQQAATDANDAFKLRDDEILGLSQSL